MVEKVVVTPAGQTTFIKLGWRAELDPYYDAATKTFRPNPIVPAGTRVEDNTILQPETSITETYSLGNETFEIQGTPREIEYAKREIGNAYSRFSSPTEPYRKESFIAQYRALKSGELAQQGIESEREAQAQYRAIEQAQAIGRITPAERAKMEQDARNYEQFRSVTMQKYSQPKEYFFRNAQGQLVTVRQSPQDILKGIESKKFVSEVSVSSVPVEFNFNPNISMAANAREKLVQYGLTAEDAGRFVANRSEKDLKYFVKNVSSESGVQTFLAKTQIKPENMPYYRNTTGLTDLKLPEKAFIPKDLKVFDPKTQQYERETTRQRESDKANQQFALEWQLSEQSKIAEKFDPSMKEFNPLGGYADIYGRNYETFSTLFGAKTNPQAIPASVLVAGITSITDPIGYAVSRAAQVGTSDAGGALTAGAVIQAGVETLGFTAFDIVAQSYAPGKFTLNNRLGSIELDDIAYIKKGKRIYAYESFTGGGTYEDFWGKMPAKLTGTQVLSSTKVGPKTFLSRRLIESKIVGPKGDVLLAFPPTYVPTRDVGISSSIVDISKEQKKLNVASSRFVSEDIGDSKIIESFIDEKDRIFFESQLKKSHRIPEISASYYDNELGVYTKSFKQDVLYAGQSTPTKKVFGIDDALYSNESAKSGDFALSSRINLSKSRYIEVFRANTGFTDIEKKLPIKKIEISKFATVYKANKEYKPIKPFSVKADSINVFATKASSGTITATKTKMAVQDITTVLSGATKQIVKQAEKTKTASRAFSIPITTIKPISLVKTRSLIWETTRIQPKQASVQAMQERTTTKIIAKQAQKQILKEAVLTVPKQAIIEETMIKTATRAGQDTRNALRTETITKTMPKTIAILRTKTLTKTTPVKSWSGRDYHETKIKIPQPIIQLPNEPPIQRKESDFGGKTGFDVLVKRKGGFTKANKILLEEGSAYALGQAITEGTAARSFIVVKSQRKGRTQKLNLPGFSPDRYYSSKSNAIVERSKFAINTPGELREITYKGIWANKTKGGGFL